MSEQPMDRLTGQVSHIAGIIGKLGISLADAQKEMNADYLRNLLQLVKLISETARQSSEKDKVMEEIKSLIELLAPSKYQFTETEFEFSADLSESREWEASGGLGLGLTGFALTAAGGIAYGYDYRAAAHIKTVLHASGPNRELTRALLDRAKGLAKVTDLEKVETKGVDLEIQTTLQKIKELIPEKTDSAEEKNENNGSDPKPGDDGNTNPGNG